MVNGQESYLTYANKNDTTSQSNLQGSWKAQLIEFNGQYYKSTQKSSNGKVDEGSVAAIRNQNFNTAEEVETWLTQNGFEAVQ